MNLAKFFRFYPLLIPLVLWFFLLIVLQSNWYQQNPSLASMGLTVDFLLIIPLLYFLSIRKKDIPNFTVFTVFVVGLIIASFLIPDKDQSVLNDFKFYVLPLIELGVLVFVIYKTTKMIKEFKRNRIDQDFYSTLLKTTKSIFPKAVSIIIAVEISMIYYAFFSWKSKSLSENEFSYHKKNALLSIIGGLTLVIVAETVGLHAWLVKWNQIIGWIITCLSAYTALQFFALAKSIVQRPVFIDTVNNILHLKYGFFSDFKVGIDVIESVEINTSDLPEDKSIVPFSPLGGIGEHNVIIHFKKETVITGLYGFKKKANSIALFIDEKEKFVNQLELNMLKSA